MSMLLSKYTRFFVFGILGVLVLLCGCKSAEIEQQIVAHLRIINASPTYATYNVYVDGTKVNNSGALPLGGTVSFLLLSPGTHEVKFTAGSNTTPILTQSLSLERDKVYSIYLLGSGNTLEAFVVHDESSITSDTKAVVKFLNLSPDAGALDLAIKGGADLAKGVNYKENSAYIATDAKKQTLEIKDASGNVLASFDTEFFVGRFYTIISSGFVHPGADDRAFGGQSIEHR